MLWTPGPTRPVWRLCLNRPARLAKLESRAGRSTLCTTVPGKVSLDRVVAPWPKHLRTCFMCSSAAETENVYHFVMNCPCYEPHRCKLFTRVARISAGFATSSPDVQFLTLLGRRTGTPSVDSRIDYCMKRYLRKAWNIRRPLTDRINNVFGTTYSVYCMHMKTTRKGRGVTRTTRPSSVN